MPLFLQSRRNLAIKTSGSSQVWNQKRVKEFDLDLTRLRNVNFGSDKSLIKPRCGYNVPSDLGIFRNMNVMHQEPGLLGHQMINFTKKGEKKGDRKGNIFKFVT